MSETNLSPAGNNTPPNADQRIADLERLLQETNQRYAASSEEGKRLAQRVQQFEQQFAERQPVPRRAEDRLQEIGVDTGALNEFFQERLNQTFQPIIQQAQAQQQGRSRILAEYPNYNEFESKVSQFVESDPALSAAYQQAYTANPQVAMEYALLKYGEAQRRANPAGNGIEHREQQAQAQVPNTSGGGQQRGSDHGPQERVQRAFEAWQQNPNRYTAEAFAKARFAQVVPDEFLQRGGIA